jgi:uncharacterized protein YjiS (DUF1127 family)
MMRTGLIAALAHRIEIWKARQDLHRLDDHLLADIGLRRADINRVVDYRSQVVRSQGPARDRMPVSIRGVAAE